MAKFFSASLTVFILLLTGCSSVTKDINVETALDPKVNLSGYKNYTWLGAASVLNDPSNKWEPPAFDVDGDIKYLIDRGMKKRGIVMTDPANADLAVGFFTGVDMDAMQLKKDPETKVELLENVPGAAMVIVFVDIETGYVIWVGKAVADVEVGRSDEEVRERLDYAVSEMFKQMK